MVIAFIINKMNNKVDYLFPDEEYKPVTANMEKVRHYVNIE